MEFGGEGLQLTQNEMWEEGLQLAHTHTAMLTVMRIMLGGFMGYSDGRMTRPW